MIAFLSGISVTCFVCSYSVALLAELSRLFWMWKIRPFVTIGFAIAGIFAHAAFLVMRSISATTTDLVAPATTTDLVARATTADASTIVPGILAGWFDWGLLCALAIAIWYLVVAIRKPDTAIGYFLLPMVLALIALTELVRDAAPFSRDDAAGGWSMLHGLAMTVGCAAVLIGFVAGVMFLLQSHRLKNKRAGSTRIKLPTLEWLQTLNRRCLMVSTVAVAIGFVAGIVMNLNRWGYVPWSNQGVLLSGVLMLWLLGASVTEFVYAPASRGRKIAYLTLASLGFLVLTVFGVVMGGHGE